jgi:hypothetical protein
VVPRFDARTWAPHQSANPKRPVLLHLGRRTAFPRQSSVRKRQVRSKPVACFHPVHPQRLCTRPDPPSGIPGATMWENLTPADLDRVKHELARERAATLIRHAAEVQQLDARYNEVETLNQLINAFAEKYGKTNMLLESRDEASPALHVEQQISPTPLRRLGGR